MICKGQCSKRQMHVVVFATAIFVLCCLPQVFSQNIVNKPTIAEIKALYPIEDGNLWIKPYQSLFFNMSLDEVRTDTIHVYNSWGYSMQLEFKNLPEFLSMQATPQPLPPGTFGSIVVTYNAALRNDYDMVYDNIDLYTNDTITPHKKLGIAAVITDKFDNFTLRQLRDAPIGRLSETSWDFGTSLQGYIVRYQLQLFNDGKDTLAIRKIISTCGCTTGKPDKMLIPPGEHTGMLISFNTFGREGYHSKSVTVLTNDPENPRLIFVIGGNIKKN